MSVLRKYSGYLVIAAASLLVYCSSGNTSKNVAASQTTNDTIRIANDSLEYEITIIDPGFSAWILRAAPRGYYSQQYLEARNRMWVQQWNILATSSQATRNLFIMTIDYDPKIDYGYEVNYMLFNYLTYFQLTNNLSLGGFIPHRFQ